MRFEYTQVFLLVWIAAFWMYYMLTYGQVEEKHERATRARYGIRPKWAPLFGLAFIAWTAVILVYFFHVESIEWGGRIAFLDAALIKAFAIALLCLAFLLNILFTISIGKSIRDSLAAGGEAKLVTTGVYRYIRHPGYLAFFALGLGCFLIIPNFLTLALLAYTCAAVIGHTGEEEEKLLRMYGEAYKQYQQQTGRFFPKLFSTPRGGK